MQHTLIGVFGCTVQHTVIGGFGCTVQHTVIGVFGCTVQHTVIGVFGSRQGLKLKPSADTDMQVSISHSWSA